MWKYVENYVMVIFWMKCRFIEGYLKDVGDDVEVVDYDVFGGV